MAEKILIFGDLHANWRAGKVILDQARSQNINFVVTLGDEGPKFFSMELGAEAHVKSIFDQMIQYRDEHAGRRLVCLIGNDTPKPPGELMGNYVGATSGGELAGPFIWKHNNMIAGHKGERILEDNEELIRQYHGNEPLVIFHAHSHSMGVLPEYRWLGGEEKVRWLKRGKSIRKLKPGRVYWVNPGGHTYTNDQGIPMANFAIYDREQHKISLRSIPVRI